MKPRLVLIRIVIVALACLSCSPKASAVVSDILPSARREAALALAVALSRPGVPAPLPSPLRDPFHPGDFDSGASVGARSGGPLGQGREAPKLRTDEDILAFVAERIAPAGLFVMNGQPILLIGKKKYKTGDRLTIDLDGHDIDLEITAIERSTFSLRLNGAEVTRPINQGKHP